MTMDLFEGAQHERPWREELCPGAAVLRRFAIANETAMLVAVDGITARSPFRHMTTLGGFRMSVAMTNCGNCGWVTDGTGYRYDGIDPESASPWPAMPDVFLNLAKDAASMAGFGGFVPDACLINRYEPGARLALHQDKNERDFNQPIVSVSLGVPAIFLFGGFRREDKALRVRLTHGDVVVWGGPARMRYHGVMPIKQADHSKTGAYRINLTFRKAA